MKYIMVIVVGILCMTYMVTGCNNKSIEKTGEKDMAYEQISQKEAHAIMSQKGDYIILDVRTEEEYRQGHIPNAICVPNETIVKQPPRELPDKDQEILVYCRSGNRSAKAAAKLAAMGYTNIKEFGGILSWKYETTTK